MTDLINREHVRDKDVLYKQYELISSSADKITERRQNTNMFYLGINSFIFGLASYLTSINSSTIPILLSIIGILISFTWYKNIQSFRQLNSAKFKVIHELEGHLPTNIFKKEDEYLKPNYYKLTSIEKWIPTIFGILYFFIILLIIS